jgi:signal transduction histidine kinase
VAHGSLAEYETGVVIAPKGEPVPTLWVILSGRVTVRVDRGAGPRRVMSWLAGDVSGMLPYSRMKGPPGDNYLEEPSEILHVHEDHFRAMAHECPVFTAYTVHLMLDRARSFNASDLQDEKMMSLGRLAAGLAHELNNPASATVRSAKLLKAGLANADRASRELGVAGLKDEQIRSIERIRSVCVTDLPGGVLSPIQLADREDEIADWLGRHGSDSAHAAALAETAVTLDVLEELADVVSGAALDAALRWIAAGCSTHALVSDIEQAATRIHDLVAAVKRFTYMDRPAGPETVDVGSGLRDTIRVMGSKARSKSASVSLDVETDLPPVRAVGGELNQVWLNLIDNALDAIADGGSVTVSARRETDRVVVRIADDGPGIPREALPRIFDPFFTTKPPGQGTGLGLEIARRLLGRNRGEISVDSRPGRTEFRVGLPVDPSGAA